MQQFFCTHCGKPIGLHANFCSYCGAATKRIANTEQSGPSVPPAPQPAVSAKAPEAKDPLTVIIERRHLSPRARYLFFFNYVAVTSILIPFMIGFMFFDPLFAAIMLGIYFMMCFLSATITHNNFFFTIDSSGFEKDYGVFFKRHVGIPYEQIQNVNITRTILDRMIGVARLDIETAGSASPRKKEIVGGIRSNSEGHLPGISFEDARYFHDLLLQKVAASKD